MARNGDLTFEVKKNIKQETWVCVTIILKWIQIAWQAHSSSPVRPSKIRGITYHRCIGRYLGRLSNDVGRVLLESRSSLDQNVGDTGPIRITEISNRVFSKTSCLYYQLSNSTHLGTPMKVGNSLLSKLPETSGSTCVTNKVMKVMNRLIYPVIWRAVLHCLWMPRTRMLNLL